jgi:hypothetical protein
MKLLRAALGSALLLGLVLAACTSSGGANRGPAVTAAGERVTAWTEADGRGFRVYLRNNTATSIRITQFELYDCENADHACQPYDPRLVLGPGQSVEVLTVRPALPNYEFSFRYRYSWSR